MRDIARIVKRYLSFFKSVVACPLELWQAKMADDILSGKGRTISTNRSVRGNLALKQWTDQPARPTQISWLSTPTIARHPRRFAEGCFADLDALVSIETHCDGVFHNFLRLRSFLLTRNKCHLRSSSLAIL